MFLYISMVRSSDIIILSGMGDDVPILGALVTLFNAMGNCCFWWCFYTSVWSDHHISSFYPVWEMTCQFWGLWWHFLMQHVIPALWLNCLRRQFAPFHFFFLLIFVYLYLFIFCVFLSLFLFIFVSLLFISLYLWFYFYPYNLVSLSLFILFLCFIVSLYLYCLYLVKMSLSLFFNLLY